MRREIEIILKFGLWKAGLSQLPIQVFASQGSLKKLIQWTNGPNLRISSPVTAELVEGKRKDSLLVSLVTIVLEQAYCIANKLTT